MVKKERDTTTDNRDEASFTQHNSESMEERKNFCYINSVRRESRSPCAIREGARITFQQKQRAKVFYVKDLKFF